MGCEKRHALGRSNDNGRNLVPLDGPPTCVATVNMTISRLVCVVYQPTRITALVAADAPWAFSRRGMCRDIFYVCMGRWRFGERAGGMKWTRKGREARPLFWVAPASSGIPWFAVKWKGENRPQHCGIGMGDFCCLIKIGCFAQ